MIVSFGDRLIEALYHGTSDKGLRRLPPEVIDRTLNKLEILNAAHDIQDLRSPPGNRLEALDRDLKGFHSIRINDQWRIIFKWKDGNAYEVRFTDYH